MSSIQNPILGYQINIVEKVWNKCDTKPLKTSSKVKPLKQRTISKEKSRLIFNPSQRKKSFKIEQKRVRPLDSMKLVTLDLDNSKNIQKKLSNELDDLFEKSPSNMEMKESKTTKTNISDRIGCRSTNKSIWRGNATAYFRGKNTPNFSSDTEANLSKRMERIGNDKVSTASYAEKYRLKNS